LLERLGEYAEAHPHPEEQLRGIGKAMAHLLAGLIHAAGLGPEQTDRQIELTGATLKSETRWLLSFMGARGPDADPEEGEHA
jgi:hypothetical protein